MKTFQTLALLAGGILLASAANAQIAAPQVTPTGLIGAPTLGVRSANNAIANTGRFDRNYGESAYVEQAGSNQYATVTQASYVGSVSTADIQQTANATRADAYQQQGGDGTTYGRSDRAYIYQNGERGIASQRQMGDNNTASVRQLSGSDNWAFQNQRGDGNQAAVTQNGDTNFSNQVQTGNNHQSRTTQENVLNWSTTAQTGFSNTAVVYQK